MKFKGAIPALATPLNVDETINIPVLEKLMGYLMDKGAQSFYVGGATGEGLSLAKEERMKLTEEAVRIAGDKANCIIQIGATCFKDAVEMAKHAENAGASAISATPPIFFSYNEDDVYEYYKELSGAVHIPMMAYYSPMAGFEMNAKFAARIFEIDNVTAIKWTSSNYFQMNVLKDLTNGEMNILNGCDEMLLQGLSAGADGGIGLTYNFMYEKIKAIYDNYTKGNLAKAQEMQTKVNRIVEVLANYQSISVTKLLLREMGFDVGETTFPMRRYSSDAAKEIVANFKKAGLEI